MKRLVAIVLGVAISACLLEVLSVAYFAYETRRFFYSWDGNSAGEVAAGYQIAEAVFQPYSGYTLRPGRESDYTGGRTWRANNFGYPFVKLKAGEYCCDFPYKRKPKDLIVGIFGGSVGSGYALFAQESKLFAEGLTRIPGWEGRDVRILAFALPGFKQPQQLGTLAYFLAIGQEFDIVVNIDGFNEIVTTVANLNAGVEPSYPADTLWGAWGRQLEQYNVPVGSRAYLLSNYHRLAAQAERQAERRCSFATCYLARKTMARVHDWRASAAATTAPSEADKRSYFPTRFFAPPPAKSEIHDYTALVWSRSSEAMAAMAAARGILYLHLLQPNQWYRLKGEYLPANPNHSYGWVIDLVRQGYPKLVAAGRTLGSESIHFGDLTRILDGRPDRDMYLDDCCHYTPKGYDVIFEETLRMLRLFKSSGSAPAGGRQINPPLK